MPVSNEIKETPLEYFLARSTDPYVSSEERVRFQQLLCEKVNYEVEGAQIAVHLLGHKIVSPNQDEALHSLQTIDRLVRHCGAKVHTRVGKFRFLNQLVRLLTPKYLGKSTSPEVKDQATVLLYTWQRSMGHVEKFKEVYENLKEHDLITEDPEIEEERVLNIQPPPPKLAVFEDEHKSRLLQELLQSTNPEDLQTANRLIKSLVRSEDEKMEKIHKRSDDMENAHRLCDRIELALTIEEPITTEIEALYKSLNELRPVIFRHASEAAESEDPVLEEILGVNDQMSRVLQMFTDRQNEEKNHTAAVQEQAKEPEIDLLGELQPSEPVSSNNSPYQTRGEHERHIDLASQLTTPTDDDPFIGFGSTTTTPATVRRHTHLGSSGLTLPGVLQSNNVQTKEKETASLEELLGMTSPKKTFKPAKLTLSEMSRANAQAPLSLSPLDPFSSNTDLSDFDLETAILSSPVRCLPESISFSVQQMQLAAANPVVIMDKKNIRIILHHCQNSPPGTTGVKTSLISVFNFNTHALREVIFRTTTSNMGISCRLLPSEGKELAPFTALNPMIPLKNIFLVLPLDQTIEMSDFDFSIQFSHVFEETISGTFSMSISGWG